MIEAQLLILLTEWMFRLLIVVILVLVRIVALEHQRQIDVMTLPPVPVPKLVQVHELIHQQELEQVHIPTIVTRVVHLQTLM